MKEIRLSLNPEPVGAKAFVSSEDEDFQDVSIAEAIVMIREGALVTVALPDTHPHHNWETKPTTAFKV